MAVIMMPGNAQGQGCVDGYNEIGDYIDCDKANQKTFLDFMPPANTNQAFQQAIDAILNADTTLANTPYDVRNTDWEPGTESRFRDPDYQANILAQINGLVDDFNIESNKTIAALAAAAAAAAARGATPSPVDASSLPQSCNPPATSNTVTVNNDASLKNALENAQCGDRIAVQPGSYTRTSDTKTANYVLKQNCSAGSPIVIEASGSFDFPGTIHVDGSHLNVTGFQMNGGSIFVTGSNNRVSGNVLKNPQYVGIRLLNGARNNIIDRNEIAGPNSRGVEIQLSPGQASNNTGNQIIYNHIHSSQGSGNGHEAIRILTDPTGCTSGTVIGYNVLDNVDVAGEGEAISIKTSCNQIIGNQLLNSSNSDITIRNGNNNLVHDNYVSGSRGIRVLGADNKITNNTVNGGIISIMAGSVANAGDSKCENCGGYGEGGAKAGHAAARNTTVTGNQSNITVGYYFQSSGTPEFQATNTQLSNNTGNVNLSKQTGTSQSGSGQGSGATGFVQLSEVGPGGC